MKCVCKTCGDNKRPNQMFRNNRSHTLTEVCLECVVNKRTATRLTNSPHAPHTDVGVETKIATQIKQLRRNLESLGMRVANMLFERGEDGLYLVIDLVQKKRIRITA